MLKTKEFSPLEPDVSENKYYAANVGDLKEKTKGSKEGIELVQIKWEYSIENPSISFVDDYKLIKFNKVLKKGIV